MRQPCPRLRTRSHTPVALQRCVYLHLRMLPAQAGADRSRAAVASTTSQPPLLDPVKLAAMGVRRPTLKRRLILLSGPTRDPFSPPEAA
jgi:hypothetical protein